MIASRPLNNSSWRRGWRSCGARAHASPSNGAWRRSRTAQASAAARLPPISFSTDPAAIDAEELADLLGQLAGFAPSHAFHTPGTRAGEEAGPAPPAGGNGGATPGSKSSSASGSTDGASACNGSGSTPATAPQALSRVSAARLRAALDCSLVCVAAFASEQHLPPHQHLESRGLPGAGGTGAPAAAGWWAAPSRPRRVLVGFARAVGDGAFVATLHDVAVMPELQGRGLGRQLLDRLTRQLLRQGIVDVGLVAPSPTEGFFQRCSFGPDPEGAVTQLLSPAGLERWRRPGPWEFAPRPGLETLLLQSL